MARRKAPKECEIANGVAQLLVFLVFAAMCLPAVRQMVLSLGVFAIGAVVLAGLVTIGVFLIRRSERKPPFSTTTQASFDVASSSPGCTGGTFATPLVDRALPATTEQLIEKLGAIDWFQFEKVVAVLYQKQGYNVSRRGGANPDGGIDLIRRKDGETKAVQCKQWNTRKVGVKPVREFLGALTAAHVQKGILITLRGYTGQAKEFADDNGIVIINEAGLTAMLAAIDTRLDGEIQEILRDTRKFCPKCEHEMVLRIARKGAATGNQFWGCSEYPRCRFTLPVIW